MPYTRPWDQVFALPGSRDADEIDDNDREHHTDLTERLDDILEGGAAADPWVLKHVGINVDGTGDLPILPYSGVGSQFIYFDPTLMYVSAFNGQSGTWIAPIPLERGSTLKFVHFTVSKKVVAGSMTCRVVKIDNSTGLVSPTTTLLSSQVAPQNANLQLVSTTDLSAVGFVDANHDFYVAIDFVSDNTGAGSGPQLHAITVNFKAVGA